MVWGVPRDLQRVAKDDHSPVAPSLASLEHGLMDALLLNLVAHTASLILSLPHMTSFFSSP